MADTISSQAANKMGECSRSIHFQHCCCANKNARNIKNRKEISEQIDGKSDKSCTFSLRLCMYAFLFCQYYLLTGFALPALLLRAILRLLLLLLCIMHINIIVELLFPPFISSVYWQNEFHYCPHRFQCIQHIASTGKCQHIFAQEIASKNMKIVYVRAARCDTQGICAMARGKFLLAFLRIWNWFIA